MCEAVFFGSPNVVPGARGEAEYRRLDCQAMIPLVQSLQQRRAAAAAAVLSRPAPTYTPYQLPMPPAIPPQHQTVCTTERYGSQLQTVCR